MTWTKYKAAFAGLFLLCFCIIAMAQEPPSFTAICSTEESRRFDHYRTFADEEVGPEWSENESFFNSDWAFTYKGGEVIEIAGSPYPVMVVNESVLLAIEPSANDIAGTLWTYAINLEMEAIIAAEVNSATMGAPSLKARIVSFDCKWSYH